MLFIVALKSIQIYTENKSDSENIMIDTQVDTQPNTEPNSDMIIESQKIQEVMIWGRLYSKRVSIKSLGICHSPVFSTSIEKYFGTTNRLFKY
jgi:hypothetical protein